MSTTKTRRELIDRVLDSLGILVPGQAPTAENVSRVDNMLDSALAQLSGQDILYVDDAGTANPPTGGAIESSVFLPLGDVVAWFIAGAFNLAGDPALKVCSDIAIANLRQIGRPARTRRTLRTDTQLSAGSRRWVRFNYTTGQ